MYFEEDNDNIWKHFEKRLFVYTYVFLCLKYILKKARYHYQISGIICGKSLRHYDPLMPFNRRQYSVFDRNSNQIDCYWLKESEVDDNQRQTGIEEVSETSILESVPKDQRKMLKLDWLISVTVLSFLNEQVPYTL